MRFIKSTIIFRTNLDGEYILINGLNGLVDVLDERDLNILRDWKAKGVFSVESNYEQEFFSSLKKRGYIVSNEKEENNYKESQIKRLEERYKDEKKNITDAGILITYNCNFACKYCFELNNVKTNTVITEEMVDKIEKLYPNLKSILLYGGEPLLKENKNIVNYITEKFKRTEFRVITNGYEVDEFIGILKSIKVEWIQITLDGDKEYHDKSRVLKGRDVGTYEKILSNIDLLIKNNIKVKIRMNINQNNYESCLKLREELKKRWHNTNLLLFELQPLFQLGDDIKNHLEPILYSVEEFEDNILGYSIGSIENLSHNEKPFSLKYNNCFAETGGRIFDCDGNIYSCMVGVGNKNMCIGTYYPEYKYFKNSLINRNIMTIPKCRKCRLALLCGGGCGNLDSERNGRFFKGECGTIMRLLIQYVEKFGYRLEEEVVL